MRKTRFINTVYNASNNENKTCKWKLIGIVVYEAGIKHYYSFTKRSDGSNWLKLDCLGRISPTNLTEEKSIAIEIGENPQCPNLYHVRMLLFERC